MSGMMDGMMNKAYGVGNQAGTMWDQMMGTGAQSTPGQATPAGQNPQAAAGKPAEQGGMMPKQAITAPKMSPYASQGMGGYKDMSTPQAGQGQDLQGLISMLQGGVGGQRQRGRY
jgi:hypothetical protein